jgi:hypothetical protein
MKLGKSSEEWLMMSQNAYGKEAMNRASMLRWWTHFKDGNKRVIRICANFLYNEHFLRHLMKYDLTFMVFENKVLRKMLRHKSQAVTPY